MEQLGFAGLCQSLAMTTNEIGDFAYPCEALNEVDRPTACSVLDSATGEFLEHCQLRRDPRYKITWDKSYSNKLGRLCQGIGTGTKPGTKRVAGTNTFFLIKYDDIRRSAILLSSAKSDQRRMTQIVPRSPLVAARFSTQETSAPTLPRLNSSSCSLTVFSLARAHASAVSISRTSVLTLPCLILNMFGSKCQTFRRSSSKIQPSRA